jgi:XTP/dITP diphosphohydrolase
MIIYFATSNKYKFEEVNPLFKKNNIKLRQLNIEKPELKDKSAEEIVKYAAEFLANKHNKNIIVEDTGIYFKAYKDFPGVHSKWIFLTIGYEGILKLLEGKNKEAYFKTVVGYCAPRKKPIIFYDTLKGNISKEVKCLDKDVMPYERIFIPKKFNKTLAEVHEKKGEFSHRIKAFKKLILNCLFCMNS